MWGDQGISQPTLWGGQSGETWDQFRGCYENNLQTMDGLEMNNLSGVNAHFKFDVSAPWRPLDQISRATQFTSDDKILTAKHEFERQF